MSCQPSRQHFFCLETACQLLRVSIQSYYRPRSRDALEIEGDTRHNRKIARTAGTTSKNPFDEDFVDQDERTTTDKFLRLAEENLFEDIDEGQERQYGFIIDAYMDIKQIKLDLTATFYDHQSHNFGFICQTLGYDPRISKRQKKMVICFRGTSHMENMITDLKFALTQMQNYKVEKNFFLEILSFEPCKSKGGGGDSDEGEGEGESYQNVKDSFSRSYNNGRYVHSGFQEAYQSIRYKTLRAFVLSMYKTLYEEKENQEDQEALLVQFCGHSLGGALALLCAYDVAVNIDAIMYSLDVLALDSQKVLKASKKTMRKAISKKLKPVISVYTFGAPKIGNNSFCRHIDSMLQAYYRVELDGDVVTQTPPGASYTQGGQQILIDPYGTGACIVNPSGLENQLLNSYNISIKKHTLDRYRYCLEKCFHVAEFEEYIGRNYGKTTSASHLDGQFEIYGMKQDVATELPSWLYHT